MSSGYSPYMKDLQTCLMDSRKVSEITAKQYIRMLYNLNDKERFNNLNWLKNKDELQTKIDKYSFNSQYAIYAIITSALSTCKTKSVYKAIHQYWADKLKNARIQRDQQRQEREKTEVQKDNWLTWDEVTKKYNELKEQYMSINKLKTLTASQYDTLLSYLVLALYVLIPPRRNEYMSVTVVPKIKFDEYDATKNYYDIERKRFVFNKYKTAKKYGQQVITVPDELHELLMTYLKHNPLQNKNGFPLLVRPDGTPLTAMNSITRILNRIFGRNIGSSMLRHFYVSSKYANVTKEMEKDAKDMGHSVAVQRTDYIKKE